MAGKREFIRDHRFTVADYLVWYWTMALIAMPMFFGLILLMAPFVGPGVPGDAVLVLVVLSFLLSACAGMSAGLALVRRMARRQGRWK